MLSVSCTLSSKARLHEGVAPEGVVCVVYFDILGKLL